MLMFRMGYELKSTPYESRAPLVWTVKPFAGSPWTKILSSDMATETINTREHMATFLGACLLINPFAKGTV